jgi:hypothetical protein
VNNVSRDARRHFRNKKKAYLKAKIQELETNSKIKNLRDLYRGIGDFKKGDLVADSHSILAMWRNNFCQLLNIHGIKDARQTEIHTAKSIVPEPLRLIWLLKS